MFHEPVLLGEAVELLVTDKNGVYIDGTLGGGSHSQAILLELTPSGKLIGFDLDKHAIQSACERLKNFGARFHAEQANFQDLATTLAGRHVSGIHGLILDLGISSHQIDTGERGFSFDRPGPLDMRMNRKQELTARQIVNSYSLDDLTSLFRNYGEINRARSLARLLIKERQNAGIDTTEHLKKLVSRITPYKNRAKELARVFQALRIAVNGELENLSLALRASLDYLVSGGRIVVISYHSLEDRIVKNFFKEESERCVCPPEIPVCWCGRKGRLKILTKKPIGASEEEVRRNRRSRSAKLRAAAVI